MLFQIGKKFLCAWAAGIKPVLDVPHEHDGDGKCRTMPADRGLEIDFVFVFELKPIDGFKTHGLILWIDLEISPKSGDFGCSITGDCFMFQGFERIF